MSQQTRRLYIFGSYRLDTQERLLLRDGEPLPLTPKAFDVLVALVEEAGRLVEKGVLMKRLWPDSFVEEGSLAQNVSLLRKTLGESGTQKFIETVPRRGYRFVARVETLKPDGERVQQTDAAIETDLNQAAGTPASDAEASHLAETGLRDRSRSTGSMVRLPMRIVLLAGLALATVVLGLYFWTRNNRETLSDPAVKSIAVLPFNSLGGNSGDEYLGIGIADTLITRLSSIRMVTVRPTSAVLKYGASGQDPVEAGRDLNVDSVLEGSIQKLSDRIRVTVRLVDVKGGSLLWGEKFDQDFTHIFDVEDSISEKVAQALALNLSGEEQRRLKRRYTEDAEAYQLYLQGRYFWNKRTQDGFKRGIALFEQAVNKDSKYALAYAGLADSYIGFTFYNFAAPNEAMPKAKAAAIKAIEIDDSLAEAHASLGHARMHYDWNWLEAEKELKRSIALNPEYATAHEWYGFLLSATDRLDEAIEAMKRARELEPTSLVMNSFLGQTLYFARRYDEGLEQCQKTIEMDANFAVAHWHLGLVYEQKEMFDKAIAEFQKGVALSGSSPLIIAALGHGYAKAGKRNEAVAVIDKLKKLSSERYVSSYEVAAIYAALGEKEQAFQWLEKAYRERCFHLVFISVWPEFDSLRSDPRLQRLTQRMSANRIPSA